MLPKILICCPSSIKKDYCFLQWWACIKEIFYPEDRFDIFVSDNSPASANYEAKLQAFGIHTAHVNPKGKGSTEFLMESHNQCRDFFLKGDYDAMLHLESDVLIEFDTLLRLIQHNKPVVSTLYFHGLGLESVFLACEPEKWGMFKTNRNFLLQEIAKGKLKRSYSSGIGCTLIARWVLEKIPFRFERGAKEHPDTFFYEDCFKNQIPCYTDTSINLRHLNISWAENVDYYQK